MPTYEEELLSSQRTAIRSASLLAAALLVAFALLDRALVPNGWLPLLGVRLGAAVLLLACARAAKGLHPVATAGVAVALIAGAIEMALFATGGVTSPYLFSMMIVQAGVSMLVPLRPMQALLLNAETLAITLLPLARTFNSGMAVAASYLACMAVVSVAGAGLQDHLRRREHQ